MEAWNITLEDLIEDYNFVLENFLIETHVKKLWT
jgi:hypothetical protein